MSVAELKKYILKSKYARHNREAKRRESYNEAVNRVRQMMLEEYPQASDEINWAYDEVEKETALGSQRAMQFGGVPVQRHNTRLYNCSASYADRLRFFQEAFYLLLCGCGVGFSVQHHHVAKLPAFPVEDYQPFHRPDKVFVVPDTIEGWADAAGVLLSSYFRGGPFPEYFGYHVIFEYHEIREKGSYLSSGAGRAPGPEPLRRSLEKARDILDRCLASGQTRLRPIDVYDIVMHFSDAVLAGGVRRSATICIFSPDDDEMARAKVGDWLAENPQRARSNNSALLVRGTTGYERFEALMEHVRQWGEPGFIWADSTELITNPCQPAWAKVRTPEGIRTIEEIKEGDQIWSKEGWTTVLKKWSTGTNPVYRYQTTAGVFYGTAGHRVVSNGFKVAVKDAESIDIIAGPVPDNDGFDRHAIMDGLVTGDGTSSSSGIVHLVIGEHDHDYFNDNDVSDLIILGRRSTEAKYLSYKVNTSMTTDEVVLTYNRRVPERYITASPRVVRSFLRGLYSANGSICGNRITLKSASRGLIEDVQLMLSSIGIRSYYTTNKAQDVEFSNGVYECKESYDLNVSIDRIRFRDLVGFIHRDKMRRLEAVINRLSRSYAVKNSYEIVEVEHISNEETFDITVDNATHTYWTQGCNVSNCVEASFWPGVRLPVDSDVLRDYQGPIGYDSPGLVVASGFQSCNLCSINGNKVKTEEDFYKACRVAAIIGTLQAGFTNFPYLGRVTEEIVRREALLGVSITSVMSNPEVMLRPEVLRRGASIVLEVNEAMATKIGINPAARATCMKPEGTGTLMLGSLGCGAHGWPFRKGIKHIQANVNEPVYEWFRRFNPQACEPSVWCQNGSTDVISFPIEAPPTAILEGDHTAVEFLGIVKSIYENWVVPGKRPERCTQDWLHHSVSNTVKVKPHEWPEVTRYIYDNRRSFAGISLLPFCGDKDYNQAPNVAVYNEEEMVAEYGEYAYAEALDNIDELLDAFDGDLFRACDAIKDGPTEGLTMDQQLAAAYFRCVLAQETGLTPLRITYLLKDIYHWDRYCMLKETFRAVDYEALIEEEDETELAAENACSGGSCLL